MAALQDSENGAQAGHETTALASRHRHLSADERLARGKAARVRSPRSTHAQLGRADGKRDPVAILAAQGESRIADLVPIRHGRMLASPFAFFRGAAAIMAADLTA